MTQPPVQPRHPARLLSPRYRYSLLAATLAGALAPAYVIRWHVGPLPTTLLEVAILATIAVFAVETIRQGSLIEWRGAPPPPPPPVVLCRAPPRVGGGGSPPGPP